MNTQKDWVIITWLITTLIFDLAAVAATGYVVFWKGYSGWWWLLTMLICSQPVLVKVLKSRYGIQESKD